MIINNVDKKHRFHCYSENLYKFLRFENNIEPINFFENKTTQKSCYVFIKSDKLNGCLDKWSENK